MTRVAWGKTGERLFENGVDRGVLYLEGQNGVPWNGLKSVNEAPTGGEPVPYYLDGYKYLNLSSAEEFKATLSAFSSPPEFAVCDGTVSLHAGLFATQQPRKSFGLSYRTLVGNDIQGLDFGYKIHLVYNALASPASRENASITNTVAPTALSWSLSTRPPRMTGLKPTAHFIVDSRLTPANLLVSIENMLYGSDDNDPYLPPVEDLMDLFVNYVPFSVSLLPALPWGGNAYHAEGTTEVQIVNPLLNFTIDHESVIDHGDGSFTINY